MRASRRSSPPRLRRPAPVQAQPLSGEDEVRVAPDDGAVGGVEALPAAGYPLGGGDPGEGVAARHGVRIALARHMGGRRLGGTGLPGRCALGRRRCLGGPAARTLRGGTGLRGGLGCVAAAREPRPHGTGGPGAGPLPVQHPFGDGDLLLTGGEVGAWRVLRTAERGPGGAAELQPAVVAVAGVDGPIAAGLAGGDLLPDLARGGPGRGGGDERERDARAARRHRERGTVDPTGLISAVPSGRGHTWLPHWLRYISQGAT